MPETVTGYMCATDWEFELGEAAGGNIVYASVADAKEHRKCLDGCGIVEVKVTFSRVIEKGNRWIDQLEPNPEGK
ncbi:hypothetical protein Q5Y75_05885 [Ruegeria sp. 2205SS24-7]|uniref:hypothetical protein n=1 Tax=Ruegeria discodermiae TaxID=3064389 RepID=UPI0027413A38|nr:hypothetical protein [Ruegeria sp. 2205SS24-7]MDP5216742.1 hypothetical protein [Ruegeria sp. 2205SS24-7]